MIRPAPPRARASYQAAWASPTVPSGSPRFVPIGHSAIRFGSASDPSRPGDSSRSNAAHHSWSV